MKITAIKPQVKQADRYSIYVDDEYSFSLSGAALLASKLVRGQAIDEQQIETFKALSADDKLYNLTLRYVALRTRTKVEIEDYLKRKHSPALQIKQITNKLIDYGFIDDTKFAEAYVSDRRRLRPTSRRKMLLELRNKHVAEDIAQQALGSDHGDEQAALREIIAVKRKQSRYQDPLKLMQYLARQGFNYEDIKTALSESAD